MAGIEYLPQDKWEAGTGRQVILKGDFAKIGYAIIELPGLIQVPDIVWVDATSVKVPATADCPAAVLMSGFPNILHLGAMVSGGLSDGKYRANTADTTMDFDVAASLWGLEKASQWYAIFALAADADAVFTIKAMPFMRVKSQASQVISLGNLVTPATGIGYGFVTDELVDGLVYFLSGASRGLLRNITANNNDSGTGGTITYDGAALSVAEGDVFIVLPPGTNFRFLGGIYNDASSNIITVYSCSESQTINFDTAGTHPFIVPPGVFVIRQAVVVGAGGGGAAHGGGGGAVEIYGGIPVNPGDYVEIVTGAGGYGGGPAGSSSYGTLPAAAGGDSTGTGGVASVTSCQYRQNQADGFTSPDNAGRDSGLHLGAGSGVGVGETPGGGGALGYYGAPGGVYVSW